VKLILLLALHRGLRSTCGLCVTAFMDGPIDDDVEIFMGMPEYFDADSGRVCMFLRSLYGLKQAPPIRYRTLNKDLRQCCFRRTKMDGGIYTRSVGGSPIFVAMYVDDLVIVGTDENIGWFCVNVESSFK
jgi:hypothetical protein